MKLWGIHARKFKTNRNSGFDNWIQNTIYKFKIAYKNINIFLNTNEKQNAFVL